MQEIYFGEFRKVIVEHYKEIQAQNPSYQSTEWFLLKYLKRIEKNITIPDSPGRIENSMRGFIRFYVDSIDEKSLLGKRCLNIYEAYRQTLRMQQQK